MYIFSGKVIKGEGRGVKIGFHTANLDNTSLSLNYGVYLAEVNVGNKIHKGLLHFGPQKTFNNKITAEVYIKDFDSKIYGEKLKVMAVKKIRRIKKFKNIKSLTKQIEKDLAFLNQKSKEIHNS